MLTVQYSDSNIFREIEYRRLSFQLQIQKAKSGVRDSPFQDFRTYLLDLAHNTQGRVNAYIFQSSI